MLDVAVIEDAAAAGAVLDPVRARLLAELHEPASAATVAARMGLPRQKVNDHLRMLESLGLLEVFAERRRGNVTERIMVAAARSYVISLVVLPDVAPDPSLERNRLCARWILALAAKLVGDVGTLITGADKAQQRLATFAMDGEVTFASAVDRAACTAELAAGTAKLMEKYHSETAAGGRKHRIVVALHPSAKTTPSVTKPAGRPGQTKES